MYVRTQWKSGDTVTSEKLNNMENGIAAAGGDLPFVSVTGTYSEGALYLDITPNDILDKNNNLIAIPLISVSTTDGNDRMHNIQIGCYVSAFSFDNSFQLKAICCSGSNLAVNTFTAESRSAYFNMFSE